MIFGNHLRILKAIHNKPGMSDEEIQNRLWNTSWTGRWLPPDSVWTWLFGYPHIINYDNDMAELEYWGLVVWEGEDPNWRYYPLQYPAAPPAPP